LSLAVVQRIQRFSQASVFKRSVLELIAEELIAEDMDTGGDETSREVACPLSDGTRAVIAHPEASALEYLYTKLKLVDRTIIDRKELASGLSELGYRLTDAEVEQLLDALDSNNSGVIGKAQFSASQIDWKVFQRNNAQRWIERARHVFAALDEDGDGVLSSAEIANLLASKLPPGEIEGALRHAMMEAARRRKVGNGNGASDGGHAKEGVGHETQEASLHDGLRFHQFLRFVLAHRDSWCSFPHEQFISLVACPTPAGF
jgi:Ca2+-binding EF-hand superfamily protein